MALKEVTEYRLSDEKLESAKKKQQERLVQAVAEYQAEVAEAEVSFSRARKEHEEALAAWNAIADPAFDRYKEKCRRASLLFSEEAG